MKKLLAIILTITAIATLFSSCSNNDTTNDSNNNEQVNQNNEDVQSENNQADDTTKNTSASNTNNKIINDDGEEFIVDTSVKGSIKTGAESIDSNKVIINGVTYEIPCMTSELFNNGFYLSDNMTFENEFDANASTNLISFDLYNDEGNFIDLSQIYNNSDSTKTLEECLLTELRIDVDEITYADAAFDFVLPGGITKDSTAADILEIYGNPNSSDVFKNGYNLEHQLTYNNHNSSHMSYSFCFNDDGTLSLAVFTYEGFEN